LCLIEGRGCRHRAYLVWAHPKGTEGPKGSGSDITLSLGRDPTSGPLDGSPLRAVVHAVEGAPLVTVGTPAAICESAEGRKSVGGVGVRETGCGEVEVPATSDETGLDPFAGGAQLDDSIDVSPIAGHVSGNPPI
jgi:hypothetical protein